MYSHRALHKQFLRHQLLIRCEKWYILSNYIPKLSPTDGQANSQKVCLTFCIGGSNSIMDKKHQKKKL